MFCTNCGNQVPDGSAYCPYCSASFANNYINPALSPAPKSNFKKILIPIICVVAVIGIIVAAVSLLDSPKKSGRSSGSSSSSSSSYTKPLNNYYKSIEDNNAELFYNVIPEYMIKVAEESGSSKDDIIEMLEETIYDLHSNLIYECGDNIKITYEVTEKEQVDESELEEYIEAIFDEYGYYIYDNIDDVGITDAYQLYVEFTVTGDEDSATDTETIMVLKEHGKWKFNFEDF